MARTQRLRARWVLPISNTPIEQGEVVIEEGRIAEVRAIPLNGMPAPEVRDFGEAVLMPGLVNVHTHLEYTVMRGLLEDIAFFPWIRELTARKAVLADEDWTASATLGAAEAVAGGVTTLGDCTDSGASLLGARTLGMRGIIYQEIFGIDESRPVGEIVAELDVKVRAMRWAAAGTRLHVGVSPHAPYSVRPALFRALARYTERENLPLCTHAAESEAETAWIADGSGPIGEMCARRGIGWKPPGLSPLAYLHTLGMLTPRMLLVHGVQVTQADVPLLVGSGAAWAHCPKSNAKLGNGIADLRLLRAGYPPDAPRIGLGTDSVASNNTVDMFEEMRFTVLAQRAAHRSHEALTARQAVELATLGGARALGLEREIGSLEPGKQADMIAVRLDSLHALPSHDPYSALVYASGAHDVELTMVGGEHLYHRGLFPRADLAASRARLLDAARRLREWQAEDETEHSPRGERGHG